MLRHMRSGFFVLVSQPHRRNVFMSCPGPLDTARIESDSGPEYEDVPTQASQRATEEIELKTPTPKQLNTHKHRCHTLTTTFPRRVLRKLTTRTWK